MPQKLANFIDRLTSA